MSRSPLAYPLNRSADLDSGGAADLQTDIMRFMAILSLCLVAIFALVQSLPMTPADPVEESATVATPVATPSAKPIEESQTVEEPLSVEQTPVVEAEPVAVPQTPPERIPAPASTPAMPAAPAQAVAESAPQTAGFSLRFESDIALMRLVANKTIGVYAIEGQRARRMSVADSRISFWDASTPKSFHEMDASTVPDPVLSALSRSGSVAAANTWGVTLPGKLSQQLADIMSRHTGGALIINIDGSIRREAS